MKPLDKELDEILYTIDELTDVQHIKLRQSLTAHINKRVVEAKEQKRKEIRDTILQAGISADDDHFTLKFTKELLIELLGEHTLEARLKG